MQVVDILAEIRDTCEGGSTSTLLDNTVLLRRINTAYEDVVAFIIGIDGKWQFDDTNFTAFPIGTTDLVAGRQDYEFAGAVLEVEGVSVLDADANFRKLTPIDSISELNIDPAEFLETDAMPIYYDKQGDSLLLYPAPAAANVTLSGGLKVFFKRTADLYTSAQVTTGTKEPGFASPFHNLIPLKVSLPYCAAYKPDVVPFLTSEIRRLEKGLAEHYGRREVDRRKGFSMAGVGHR